MKRNRDEWHDFVLPPELETRQDQEVKQPHIGPEQEEPGTSVPVADPDVSDSGVATQMQKQSLACGICSSSSDADYSGTDLFKHSFFCVDPAPALWQVANTKNVDLLEIFLVLREFLRPLPSRVCRCIHLKISARTMTSLLQKGERLLGTSLLHVIPKRFG